MKPGAMVLRSLIWVVYKNDRCLRSSAFRSSSGSADDGNSIGSRMLICSTRVISYRIPRKKEERTMFATSSPSPSLFLIVSVPRIPATSSPPSIASL